MLHREYIADVCVEIVQHLADISAKCNNQRMLGPELFFCNLMIVCFITVPLIPHFSGVGCIYWNGNSQEISAPFSVSLSCVALRLDGHMLPQK